MNYVALKMLFRERAKDLMLLCGLTFSVMLIVQQGSIFWGLMIWSQSGASNLNVPIWVADPDIAQVEEAKPIADTAVDRVRSVPGVEWAVRRYKGLLRARLSNGEYHQVTLTGLASSMLIGRPAEVLGAVSRICGNRMRWSSINGPSNGWVGLRSSRSA